MNTMQLECFLAVTETLNFARAAERLHVTQPAVTQQIHSLEAELGDRLFRRTTRTVEITQAGLLFLDDARAMLEITARAKRRAEHTVARRSEPFVIGCHSHNDVFHLTEPLRQMKERFPDFRPVIQVIPFQHLYERLSEETVDVVAAFREGRLRKSIHYQELAKIPVGGILEAGHPLAGRETLTRGDLAKFPIIALHPQKCPEDYRSLMHRMLDALPDPEVIFCDSAETSAALAQAGYGIAVAPLFFRERDPSLICLPLTDAPPMSYGIYYKTLSGQPRRRAFVELAREAFSE